MVGDRRLNFSSLGSDVAAGRVFSSLDLRRPPRSFRGGGELIEGVRSLVSTPMRLPLRVSAKSGISCTRLRGVYGECTIGDRRLRGCGTSLGGFLGCEGHVTRNSGSVSIRPRRVVRFSRAIMSLVSSVSRVLGIRIVRGGCLSLSRRYGAPVWGWGRVEDLLLITCGAVSASQVFPDPVVALQPRRGPQCGIEALAFIITFFILFLSFG